MKLLSVVEEEIPCQRLMCLNDSLVLVQIDFLVLNGSPQLLAKDIVEYSTSGHPC
jgi:hypothetical protein